MQPRRLCGRWLCSGRCRDNPTTRKLPHSCLLCFPKLPLAVPASPETVQQVDEQMHNDCRAMFSGSRVSANIDQHCRIWAKLLPNFCQIDSGQLLADGNLANLGQNLTCIVQVVLMSANTVQVRTLLSKRPALFDFWVHFDQHRPELGQTWQRNHRVWPNFHHHRPQLARGRPLPARIRARYAELRLQFMDGNLAP